MQASAPLSLLLMDLDHFKRSAIPCDLVGDRCSGVVAQVIREHAPAIRRRLGGEEFALALRGRSRMAAALAESCALRSLLDPSTARRAPDRDGGIGVARSVRTVARPRLLRRADERMYRAKQEGRNRVFERLIRPFVLRYQARMAPSIPRANGRS